MQHTLNGRIPLEHKVIYGVAGVLALVLGASAGLSSMVGTAAVVGLVFAAGCLISWRFGVLALLGVACVDGFIKHVQPNAINYVLKDATFALVILGLIADLAMHYKSRPIGSWRNLWAFGIYILFLTVEIVHAPLGIGPALAGFREHALFAMLLPVGIVYFDSARRLTSTAGFVVVAISFVSAIAVVQYAMGSAWLRISPGMAKASLHYVTFHAPSLRIPGVAALVYRTYSTLVDPAALGIACMLGTLFAAAALGRTRGAGRIGTIGAIGLCILGLLLSETRSAMIGAAIGIIVLMIFATTTRGMRSIAVLGFAAALVAIPVAVKLTGGAVSERVLQSQSVSYAAGTREEGYRAVVAALREEPFGNGLGLAGAGGELRDAAQASDGIAIDNLYLAYLYEIGPLGLGLMLLMQGSIIWLTLRAMRSTSAPGPKTVYAGLLATEFALLASGAFMQGPFDYAPVAQIFWLFAGATAIPQRASKGDLSCVPSA